MNTSGSHQAHAGLPPMADTATFAAARSSGFSVETCGSRLTRYQGASRRRTQQTPGDYHRAHQPAAPKY